MSTHHRRESHTNYERLGWEAKNKGEVAKAIVYFDKALHYRQKPYFSLHGKGECLLLLRDIEKAEECFNKAIQIDSHHPWAYHGLGRVYFYQERYDTALACFEKSISLESRGAVAWHWKGRALLKQGKYAEAEQALLKALDNAISRKHGREKIISHIEADLKELRENKVDEGKEAKIIIRDSVIIQGDNNAPVNVKGNQANDDAVLNRPIINSTEQNGGEDEN